MNEETKNVLQSKTIWGALVAIVGVILNLMGFDAAGLNGMEGDIVTVVGAALAAYGRVVAVKKIK
jgi:hypothetical protein